jgi:hypothetical protein
MVRYISTAAGRRAVMTIENVINFLPVVGVVCFLIWFLYQFGEANFWWYT